MLLKEWGSMVATVAHEKIGVIMSRNQSELEKVIGIEGIIMS